MNFMLRRLAFVFFGLLASALTAVAQSIQQGSVVIGQAVPGSTLSLEGRAVPVMPDGRFVIGFDRDAKASWQLDILNPQGGREVLAIEVAQRSYDVDRIEGVPQRTVTPDRTPELEARIARESAEIRQAREVLSSIAYFDTGFIWPATGRISGKYGDQRFYNGTPGRPHYGVDIAAPTGTPVLAPSDGRILATQDDNFFSGGTLMMDHGWGLVSAFLHLSKIHVVPGQVVRQGDVIAEVGSTGRSTGPHLDWRMNWGPDVRVDVQLLLPPL